MAWTTENVQSAYACNPEILKHFRKLRGWSQDELAAKAGYSRRLITKAETGKSISSETVDDLAMALSTPEMAVHPEDLVCDPVLLAKRYINSLYTLQKNAIEDIQLFLDDEVEINIQGNPEEIPFAGSYTGVAGFGEMLARFFSVLEVPPNYDHTNRYHFIGNGNEVIVWGDTLIQPIGLPITSPVEITLRMKFRRGKIFLFEDRYDLEKAVRYISQLKQDMDSQE